MHHRLSLPGPLVLLSTVWFLESVWFLGSVWFLAPICPAQDPISASSQSDARLDCHPVAHAYADYCHAIYSETRKAAQELHTKVKAFLAAPGEDSLKAAPPRLDRGP